MSAPKPRQLTALDVANALKKGMKTRLDAAAGTAPLSRTFDLLADVGLPRDVAVAVLTDMAGDVLERLLSDLVQGEPVVIAASTVSWEDHRE